MTPNTETVIKVYGDVGWSEEEFSLFLEMLNIGKSDSLIADIMQFLGARPTYVAAKQLETSIEVDGTVYEPLISIHDNDYTIIIHEGSYYMIIDCTSPELQTTVYKPTLH